MSNDESIEQTAEEDDEIAAPPVETEEEDTDAEALIEPFNPAEIRMEMRQFTVDLLLRRIKTNEIDLSPDFQRTAGLWTDSAQSRLIESMLLRIPLPAFYMDATNDDHWLVVDGLQRLTTIRRYIIDQEFALTGLDFFKAHIGKRFSELPRPMQRRIEETQVTIYLIQPGTPPEVKFNIFKRINTGGLPLSPQEIRHALNQGAAAEMLKRMVELQEFGRVASAFSRDQRMTDRECALRFIAFLITPYTEYKSSNFDAFLSDRMKRLNAMSDVERGELQRRFGRAMNAAYRIFEKDAFRKPRRRKARRKPVNKALFEAWSVNLDAVSDAEVDKLVERRGDVYEAFLLLMAQSREFDAAISQGTGDVKKVKLRFEAIRDLIHGVLA